MSEEASASLPATGSGRARPGWFVPAVIGSSIVALGIGITFTWALASAALQPASFTAKGDVVLVGNTCADVPSGYDDITEGAGVTVKDAAGKVVALGALGKGKTLNTDIPSCVYAFSVADVPAGSKIYGVEVTHRGELQYKEGALRKDGAVMSLVTNG